MKKILNYVVIMFVLITSLVVLTGCGNNQTQELVDVEVAVNENEEVVEEGVVESTGDGNFDGLYVAQSKDDPMEGLAIIPTSDSGADKVVFIKDSSGSGCTRVGKEDINGDKMSQELANEIFTITDVGTNVKIEHPMFTLGEEVEMIPETAEFCGIYEKEETVLVVFKDANGYITVAYINTRYDTSTCLTFADYTITGNVLEGKDDVYSEPIKLTLNGDTISVEIKSEDARWNSANTDFTLMK